MADGPVIFDVDGVLLHLTPDEEDAFFWPFEHLYGMTGLSRRWDDYRIRNDEDIIDEILAAHLGGAPTEAEHARIVSAYLGRWREARRAGQLASVEIPGARKLLELLASRTMTTGIATANLREAARLRLDSVGLWDFVKMLAHGADGGGAKREILKRAIAGLGLPAERIVYVGDNLNDVDAGLANGVQLVGFALDPARRERLRSAGAPLVSGDHQETLDHIRSRLGHEFG